MEFACFSEYVESERKAALECITCGQCLESCPIFPFMKFKDLGPVILMERVNEALAGGKYSEEAYETIYSCMACGLCASQCPVGVSTPLLMHLARIELGKNGYKAPELFESITPRVPYNLVQVLGGLQMKPSMARWYYRAPKDAPQVDVVLFLGCYILSMPNVVFTLLDILEKMEVSFVALGSNDLCCGLGYFLIGDLDTAGSMAGELLANIMAFKPKHVLFECGGCYSQYAFIAPKFMDVPFKPEHLSQFLFNNLDKLKFTKEVNKTVTYHDSCGLGRGANEYDAPRRLLSAIPGVTLVEMKHHHEDASCCGGLINFSRTEVTLDYRKARLKEAIDTGADILAVTCPLCHLAFTGLDKNHRLKVVHDIVLLGEAMGISYEDKIKTYAYGGDVDRIVSEGEENLRANNLESVQVKSMLQKYLKCINPEDI